MQLFVQGIYFFLFLITFFSNATAHHSSSGLKITFFPLDEGFIIHGIADSGSKTGKKACFYFLFRESIRPLAEDKLVRRVNLYVVIPPRPSLDFSETRAFINRDSKEVLLIDAFPHFVPSRWRKFRSSPPNPRGSTEAQS